jgi:hypothetical protein
LITLSQWVKMFSMAIEFRRLKKINSKRPAETGKLES